MKQVRQLVAAAVIAAAFVVMFAYWPAEPTGHVVSPPADQEPTVEDTETPAKNNPAKATTESPQPQKNSTNTTTKKTASGGGSSSNSVPRSGTAFVQEMEIKKGEMFTVSKTVDV